MKIQLPEPISGGLLLSYKCSARCDHCMYACSPQWNDWISEEDLEKIFDPFFTTKDPDKGTGLGLSISLRIIESLGGEVKVRSEEGKGSTFEIYFPAVI